MSKFTMICHNPATHFSGETTYTAEFEAEGLDTVLSEFQHFLRGCGYYFDGNVDIVPDETMQVESYDEKTYDFGSVENVVRTWVDSGQTMNSQHSEAYYDTERNK